MKKIQITITIAMVVILGIRSNMSAQEHDHGKHQMQTIQTIEQKKESYSCPMHPEVISDKPGECPKCGMDLVKTESKSESMDMMGTPTFEKKFDDLNLRIWLMTQTEHDKMMKMHMQDTTVNNMMDHKMMGKEKKSDKKGTMLDTKDMDHLKMMNKMPHGTHHIMLDVTTGKGKEETPQPVVELKITSPTKKTSKVELMKMMGHFGGNLTLDEKGKYSLLVAITMNTKKQEALFEYEIK